MYRQCQFTFCANVSLQGSIVTSIALSALQLPDLSQTHWVARGFLVSAMVLGALSVVAACFQQMTIGMHSGRF